MCVIRTTSAVGLTLSNMGRKLKDALSSKTLHYNQSNTCNYHSTDTVSEVESGEQGFTVRRQDGIRLNAYNKPYGHIATVPAATSVCARQQVTTLRSDRYLV